MTSFATANGASARKRLARQPELPEYSHLVLGQGR